MIAPDPESASVAQSVLATLVGRILSGVYGAGARLPSERDLAAELGVARVSVRQALGILGGWRVVETKRGSGAAVLPRRAWTSDALAAAIGFELHAQRWAELERLVRDALELRRSVVLDLLERAAPHLGAGSLVAAREAVERAWRARPEPARFVILDREVIPLVLEAAGMFPSLWLLNSMAAPYLAVMAQFTGGLAVDPGYREGHLETFALLEARDGAGARARFARHLDVADRLLVAAFPPALLTRLSKKPDKTPRPK